MVEIINMFENIGYLIQEDGTYIGYGACNKNPEELIKFEFKDHYLICTEGNKILFSILYDGMSIGTILVILQEYGLFYEKNTEKLVKNIANNFNKEYEI